jgi:hypothetical protein
MMVNGFNNRLLSLGQGARTSLLPAAAQQHQFSSCQADNVLSQKQKLKMKKHYLTAGEAVQLHFYGRVGPSGTLVDIQADLTEMVAACGNDPTKGVSKSIGTVDRDDNRADVFVDINTGRLWYNEDDGWY